MLQGLTNVPEWKAGDVVIRAQQLPSPEKQNKKGQFSRNSILGDIKGSTRWNLCWFESNGTINLHFSVDHACYRYIEEPPGQHHLPGLSLFPHLHSQVNEGGVWTLVRCHCL